MTDEGIDMVWRPFGADGRPWYLAVATDADAARTRVGGNPPECFHQPDRRTLRLLGLRLDRPDGRSHG
jgi:hypothetical protein